MYAKTVEHGKAISLRKKGYSLNEVASQLGISKSSASLWLRDISLPKKARERIEQRRVKARIHAGETNRQKTNRRISCAYEYGQEVVKASNLTPDGLRVLCALVYWCEGAKIRRRNTFSFSNSDPELVTMFMRLFRSGFPVNESKLRLNLHVHEYHNSNKQLQFWSNLTNIPLSQCHKPYLKPHTSKRTREGYEGCVSIRYLDVTVARDVEGIAKAFLSKGP